MLELQSDKMITLFANLLQIVLGYKKDFHRNPSEQEWYQLFLIAKKQALLGVTYVAIERLPKDQRPPRQLIFQWFVEAEHIKRGNEELNIKAVNISQTFFKDGFRNIILKGQSVAQYYKINNLDLYRTPGDVDIWLDGSRRDIIKYVRGKTTDCNIVYHHVDFPKMDGVEVEVHFTPSWMNSYFTNRKLQNFFYQHRDALFSQCNDNTEVIPGPSLAFDRVYILVHIYRHLFHEGVGLRQLMDYYFVLKQGFTEEEREATMRTLQELKMTRFASAVMWVLHERFGLESQYLLVLPNEKEGRFLLGEIMRSGNFGQYDPQIRRKRNESGLSHGIRKVRRNFRFVFSYPSEVICSPLFKVWHYLWRKIHSFN